MQKSVEQLLAIVDDIAPELKSSQRLFIVDLIITERDKEYYRGADQPDYSSIKEDYDNREDV